MQAKDDYQVRNYRTADLDSYHQFCLDTELIHSQKGASSQDLLGEKLRRPNYDPEKDLFVAQAGNKIVAHLDITAEPGIDRALLECLVHPDYRRRGIGSRLLEGALARLEELGISQAQFNVLEDNKIGQEFLTQRDFSHIRGFLELRTPVEDVAWQHPPVPSGLAYRHMRKGEEAVLAQLQNQCFTGSWGFHPNTEEDIIYMTTLTGHAVKDVMVAEFDGKMIAYCWVTRKGDEPVGRVHMIGVDPQYRGMKLGRGVLMRGLKHLKDLGIEELEVTVDSQNQAAYRLYLDVGFRVWKISLWYQRRVGQPA